jgi:hypothetical protein
VRYVTGGRFGFSFLGVFFFAKNEPGIEEFQEEFMFVVVLFFCRGRCSFFSGLGISESKVQGLFVFVVVTVGRNQCFRIWWRSLEMAWRVLSYPLQRKK